MCVCLNFFCRWCCKKHYCYWPILYVFFLWLLDIVYSSNAYVEGNNVTVWATEKNITSSTSYACMMMHYAQCTLQMPCDGPNAYTNIYFTIQEGEGEWVWTHYICLHRYLHQPQHYERMICCRCDICRNIIFLHCIQHSHFINEYKCTFTIFFLLWPSHDAVFSIDSVFLCSSHIYMNKLLFGFDWKSLQSEFSPLSPTPVPFIRLSLPSMHAMCIPRSTCVHQHHQMQNCFRNAQKFSYTANKVALPPPFLCVRLCFR